MSTESWTSIWPEVRAIVPVSPVWKVTTSAPGAVLASAIAWRRLPGPASVRLSTLKMAIRTSEPLSSLQANAVYAKIRSSRRQMRLAAEFIQLPLRFDAERLAAEIAGIEEAAWRPHPQGHPGNSALPLIAAGGDPRNDAAQGPMRPTPHLGRLPYLRQFLAAFGSVLGRTRLMRLD